MIAFFGNTYFDSEGHNTKTLKPCPVVSSENEMTVRKGSPAQKSQIHLWPEWLEFS